MLLDSSWKTTNHSSRLSPLLRKKSQNETFVVQYPWKESLKTGKIRASYGNKSKEPFLLGVLRSVSCWCKVFLSFLSMCDKGAIADYEELVNADRGDRSAHLPLLRRQWSQQIRGNLLGLIFQFDDMTPLQIGLLKCQLQIDVDHC